MFSNVSYMYSVQCTSIIILSLVHVHIQYIHMYRVSLSILFVRFADSQVRKTAVDWLSGLLDDNLCDFLPQLVQCLKFEAYEASPLAQLLLVRGQQCPRLAHCLFWSVLSVWWQPLAHTHTHTPLAWINTCTYTSTAIYSTYMYVLYLYIRMYNN